MNLDSRYISSDFPNSGKIYLNNASVSLMPSQSIQSMQDFLIDYNSIGPDSIDSESFVAEKLRNIRKTISKIINCQPEEIILTQSTTDGINIVANGISFSENSNLIIRGLLNQINIFTDTKIEGNIRNILAEYYGLYKVFELVDDSYDYVIRCRFDIIIQDKFDMMPIIEKLEKDEFDIFFPDEVFNFGGYQNRIFIGKYWAMQHAMTILKDVNVLMNDIKRLHPESWLKLLLDKHNVRTYQEDINHRIVRRSSVVTNWPENPFKFKDL